MEMALICRLADGTELMTADDEHCLYRENTRSSLMRCNPSLWVIGAHCLAP